MDKSIVNLPLYLIYVLFFSMFFLLLYNSSKTIIGVALYTMKSYHIQNFMKKKKEKKEEQKNSMLCAILDKLNRENLTANAQTCNQKNWLNPSNSTID